eukprot:SAG31_NODE_2094_length_6458_cov_7.319547_4_plen_104_part_00
MATAANAGAAVRGVTFSFLLWHFSRIHGTDRPRNTGLIEKVSPCRLPLSMANIAALAVLLSFTALGASSPNQIWDTNYPMNSNSSGVAVLPFGTAQACSSPSN